VTQEQIRGGPPVQTDGRESPSAPVQSRLKEPRAEMEVHLAIFDNKENNAAAAVMA